MGASLFACGLGSRWSGSEEAIYLSEGVILKRIVTINHRDQQRVPPCYGSSSTRFTANLFEVTCRQFVCPQLVDSSVMVHFGE
jgi:hypothetical protein